MGHVIPPSCSGTCVRIFLQLYMSRITQEALRPESLLDVQPPHVPMVHPLLITWWSTFELWEPLGKMVIKLFYLPRQGIRRRRENDDQNESVKGRKKSFQKLWVQREQMQLSNRRAGRPHTYAHSPAGGTPQHWRRQRQSHKHASAIMDCADAHHHPHPHPVLPVAPSESVHSMRGLSDHSQAIWSPCASITAPIQHNLFRNLSFRHLQWTIYHSVPFKKKNHLNSLHLPPGCPSAPTLSTLIYYFL